MPKFRQPRLAGLVAVGAAVTLLGTSCAALAGEPAPEVVVIGVDLELTGDGSQLGAVFRNALELRTEQVNQQRLLGGRQLELDFRDNRSDPGTSAVNLADLAIDSRVSAIITGGCGACTVAGADVINEHGVPTISLAAADEVAEPIEQRRYMFKLAPNAEHNAAALGAQLSSAGAATVALVAGVDSYSDEGVEALVDAGRRAGFEVVMTFQLGDDVDHQEAVDQIVSYSPPAPAEPPDLTQPGQPAGDVTNGPDAVVLWAPPALAVSFAGALREAGYDGAFYLDSTAVDDLFLSSAASAALEGAILIFNESLVIDGVVATSPAKAARKAWFNTYSARYGTYHAFSSFAADAIQLLVETITRLDTTDRDEIRAGLERVQIEGVSGPLRITPTNHSGLTSLGLIPLVARGDRWQAAG